MKILSKKNVSLFLVLLSAVLIYSLTLTARPDALTNDTMLVITNFYNVTYNENGGTVVSDNWGVQQGNYITLPTTTKTGYTFTHWSASNGQITYGAGSSYQVTSHIEFDAVWTADSCIITFDTNDGNLINPINQNYGTALTLPTPVKEGYDFLGWFDNEDLTGTAVSYTTMPLSTTLYAKWEIIEATISFSVNGGDELIEITEDYGSTISLPTPTKEGYTFLGWYLDEECTLSANNLTQMPDEDIVLYAAWEEEIPENFILYLALGGGLLGALVSLVAYYVTKTIKKKSTTKKNKQA